MINGNYIWLKNYILKGVGKRSQLGLSWEVFLFYINIRRAARWTNWTNRWLNLSWNIYIDIYQDIIISMYVPSLDTNFISFDDMTRSISTTVVVVGGTWLSIRRDVHCHLHSESVRHLWNQILPRVPKVWHSLRPYQIIELVFTNSMDCD